MQKKEIVLTLELLVRMDASEKLLEFFKERYPNSSATLSEVLSDLQELANTDTEYVGCALWLFDTFPPTQEPLVLNELTDKVIIHNGNLTIKVNIAGDRIIIVNGDLNTEGGINLNGHGCIWAKRVKTKNIAANGRAVIWVQETIDTKDTKNIAANGDARIWANETIKAINITAYGRAKIWAMETMKAKNIKANGDAEIWADETIDVENIAAYDRAEIWAKEKVDAIKIVAYDFAKIWAVETIDAIKIEAYDDAKIEANEINTQYIMDDDRTMIYGEINIIRPSSNQQNVTQPAN